MTKRTKMLAFGLLTIGLSPLASCTENAGFKNDAERIYISIGSAHEIYASDAEDDLYYRSWGNEREFGLTIKNKGRQYQYRNCPYYITFKGESK